MAGSLAFTPVEYTHLNKKQLYHTHTHMNRNKSKMVIILLPPFMSHEHQEKQQLWIINKVYSPYHPPYHTLLCNTITIFQVKRLYDCMYNQKIIYKWFCCLLSATATMLLLLRIEDTYALYASSCASWFMIVNFTIFMRPSL